MQSELIADCVHCGFCLPTCPTYSLWHEEMDSPRGRIYLMQGLVDSTIELTDTVVQHFDRCLGCMACVTSCPSGVQYDRLIEQTRHHVEQHHRRGTLDRLVRAGVFAVFPHRRRLRAALLLRKLPAPGPLAPLKQIAPPWSAPEWPAEHLPGEGPRVAVVAGCVASVVFGDVNAATARVLHAEGFDVHVPRRQGCCGALHAHAGRLEEGVARARALERELAGYDYVVTNAAGCGSHLKDHGEANVVDVSELLMNAHRVEKLDTNFEGTTYDTILWQSACHYRAQHMGPKSSQLMQLTGAKVQVVERCSAIDGTWGLRAENVELARRVAKPLMEKVSESDATLIAGDCLLANVAIHEGTGKRPIHPMQVLARAYGIDEAD